MRAMLNRFGRGNQTGEEHRSTGKEEELQNKTGSNSPITKIMTGVFTL